MDIKPIPTPSLNIFCEVFDLAKGQADMTCPADGYNISCLRALERRGLLVWDLERPTGKTKRWCALTKLGARYGCQGLALSASGNLSHRNRKWVRMQFDLEKVEYQEAYQIAGELALNSILAPTIADLLRIHKAAESGDYRLFYELYGIPDTQETQQFESMFDVMSKMQGTIDNLSKQLKVHQNAPQAPDTPQTSGLKPLVAPSGSVGLKGAGLGNSMTFAPPSFEDDDEDDLPDLVMKKDTSGSATKNFLASMKALQG